jgi:transposase
LEEVRAAGALQVSPIKIGHLDLTLFILRQLKMDIKKLHQQTPQGVKADTPSSENPSRMRDNRTKGGSVMLSDHLFKAIRRLRDEGKHALAIARELGIDRKTVSKYLRLNSPPRYKPRENSTRIDPFALYDQTVRNLVENHPGLSSTEIFELITVQGYSGSERTVDRRVVKILGEKPKERFFEQEYEPGEQSQFDFKESVEIPFIDGIRIAHLHFGTLPCSDIFLIHGYPFKNYECFIDGKHCFFEKIGGLTDHVRIDNLSPAVRKVLEGDRRLYTKAYQRAIDYYHFKVLPCRPARGNEKGDVERDIRTHARRIKNKIKLECIQFRDWKHFNEWLYEYAQARWTEDQKQRFKIEQTKLKALPARDPEVMCRIGEGSASLHGTVRINKSVYSVPDTAIGVPCRTIMGPYETKIYRADSSHTLIATHPTKAEGESSVLLEHILPSLLRKPHALIRWAHRDLLFPNPVCRKFYSRLKELDSSTAEREFLRCINLVQHIPLLEITAGMELIMETSSLLLFDDLKSLLFGERRPAEVIDISHLLGQRPLQPELSQYDALIPNPKGDLSHVQNHVSSGTHANPEAAAPPCDVGAVCRTSTISRKG